MIRQNEIAVSVENAQKHFSGFPAVNDVSFAVRKGEFLVLLGPSGSGKTTVLRLIAGFEHLDHGRIQIFGQTANLIPPNRRDIGLVFQHFALFPHLSVRKNIAFGLEVRKLQRKQIDERVSETLDLVRLHGLADRMPHELSGGQKQRVAIARAIVTRPKVLLLDEPLGSLDAGLRLEMQGELKRLQTELHITAIMVTHDQEEAMSIADRIAVMRDGKLLQIDTPTNVYSRPDSSFVARFMGAANVLRIKPDQDVSHTRTTLETEEGIALRCAPSATRTGARMAIIRPERIRLSEAEPDLPNKVKGRLVHALNVGPTTRCRMSIDGTTELAVNLPAGESQALRVGAEMWGSWHEDDNWLAMQ